MQTIKTSTSGMLNMLGLAKRVKARLLFSSTSEIYGDPEVHPQVEEYWGNVNTLGPRSCYDEGKRVAETMCYCYHTECGVEVRLARIFNTFGPRMDPNDGRVVSNFIIQALQHKPITIYGDGSQTRSFQYVSDLVQVRRCPSSVPILQGLPQRTPACNIRLSSQRRPTTLRLSQGLIALMNSDYSGPVNIGNPQEWTVKQFAEYIQLRVLGEADKGSSPIVYKEASKDDPKKRRPDITKAQRILHWSPKVDAKEGLDQTIQFFKSELGLVGPNEVPVIWMPTMKGEASNSEAAK